MMLTSLKIHAMSIWRVLCVLTLVLISPQLRANEVNSSETICTLSEKNVSRVVQLIYENDVNPLPCKVLYTKDGAVKESGSAKNTRGHCEKIERDIVRDLIKGGYSCNHRFTGALNNRKADVKLDFFQVPLTVSTGARPSANKTDFVDAQANGQKSIAAQDSASNSAPALESSAIEIPLYSPDAQVTELLAKLEKDLQQLLTERFADVLEEISSQATGRQTSISVDVAISLNPISDQLATALTDAQSVTPLIEKNEPVEFTAAELTGVEEQAVAVAPEVVLVDTNAPQDLGQVFALWSQAFSAEEDAHRFAAEFHRIYPYVDSRTIALNNESHEWRVAIGTGLDEQELYTRAAVLEQDIGSQFEINPVPAESAGSPAVIVVQDDWIRYLVASCFAAGKTDSQSLHSCSGFAVDEETFVNCLGGGACAPSDASSEVVELVEYLTVLSSDDPMAEARRRLMSRIEGCSVDSDEEESEFATCAARAVMTDKQRDMLDCYESERGGIGLLSCTQNESLSESLNLYERCSVDNYFAAECILENVNNEYLNSASRCVHYGDQGDVLSCALDSNLDVDQSRVLSCLKYSSDAMQRAVCIADTHLDADQAAIARCASTTDNMSELGLCTLRHNGSLSQDELQAVECLAEGGRESENLLSCVGGRLAAAELEQCQQSGTLSPSECFSDKLIVASVATGELENYLNDELLSSDIANYRQALFSDQGGDIPKILSSAALTRFFAGTVAVTKKVVKKTTSTTKKVWKKLGFGKKSK